MGGGGSVLSLGGAGGGGEGDEKSETLRDLFWTTYSKLDAVLQGLRVVWEVASRIGGVSGSFLSSEKGREGIEI